MKFFVTTILPTLNEHEIAGDVLYVDDCKVKIAGVEHELRYGDTVKHGDFSYYMNETSLSTEGFDNSFKDFWYLTSGQVPDDGERYFLIVPENINYSNDLFIHKSLDRKIVSRDYAGIRVHDFVGDKTYCEDEERAYVIETEEEYDISATEFYEAVAAHNARNVEEIVETVNEGIRIPVDGSPGKDGKPGVPGKDGKPGKVGRTGDKGDPGIPGPKGDKGDPGSPGEPGKDGKDGKPGSDGKPGKLGKPGAPGIAGKPGPQGLKGDKGDKGDKGEPGNAGADVDSKEVKKLNNEIKALHKQLKTAQDLDTKYKQRLNTQLASLGGGGSSRILDMEDVVFNKPFNLSNNDILVFDSNQMQFQTNNIVSIISAIRIELEMQYDKLVDEQISGSDTFTYIGEAAPGGSANTAEWRIKLVSEYSNGYISILWANNTEAFDKIWDDRGTYTYDV